MDQSPIVLNFRLTVLKLHYMKEEPIPFLDLPQDNHSPQILCHLQDPMSLPGETTTQGQTSHTLYHGPQTGGPAGHG